MSRYFRLKVPKTGCYGGGYDAIFDKNHIRFVIVRNDGAACVYMDGDKDPFFVYKDEADRLLAWMDEQE